MSYRDALQKSQQGGEDTAKFERTFLDCKEGAFSFWDKEKETRIAVNGVKGVVLGEAMKFDLWNSRQECFWRSNYYLNNKDVAVYDNDGKLHKRGNMEEVTAYCLQVTGGTPKKKKVLWIATERGVVELKANLVCSIDQMKPIHRDDYMDFVMEFKPRVYDGKVEFYAPKTIEILGKISLKNPPTHFTINRDTPLNDAIAEEFGVIEKAQALEHWRNHHKENREEVSTVTDTTNPYSMDKMQARAGKPSMPDGILQGAENENTSNPYPKNKEVVGADDLPF